MLIGPSAVLTTVPVDLPGPVVVAVPFHSDPELRPTGDHRPGAGVFTRDPAKAFRVAKRLGAGTVWMNTWNSYDPALPFGGYQESG